MTKIYKKLKNGKLIPIHEWKNRNVSDKEIGQLFNAIGKTLYSIGIKHLMWKKFYEQKDNTKN